ncbi:MAG: hypothetical protein CL810_15420 [Cobetia sp.]|uniref:hypothetical protein n=1 Tax=Cobetia sp. TaxID=1873876 RepID=UPI000C517647|nr:hypothetical protein [Cobetia sp.]MBK10917.1 hypothetical protein [Cobetia sp.]
MADYPVKWFSNDMGGAPALGDTSAGDFIALLKACLITGFNVTPVASATYEAESSEVLVTLTTGHGFKAWQVIEVSGADQESYNGQHRVTSVGSDWVRYAPDSAPSVSPATGSTIEIKAAPVGGWQVADEDASTHRIAFRRTGAAATDHVLMIENNGNQGDRSAQWLARMRVCESFVDIETFEEVAVQYWPASHRYSTPEWAIVADELMMFFTTRYGHIDKRSTLVAGNLNTIRPGDASHFIINGTDKSSSAEWNNNHSFYAGFGSLASIDYRSIARAYHQLPGSTTWALKGIGTQMGGPFKYPNPQTNGFYISPNELMVMESEGLRGYMPGLMQPLQSSPVYHAAILDNLPGLEGIPVLLWSTTLGREYYTDEVLLAWRLDDWRKGVGA